MVVGRSDRPLRVMVDANVLFAASVWFRFPYEVVAHAISGDYQIVLTDYVIVEAKERITQKFPEYLPRFGRQLRLVRPEMIPAPSDEDIFAHADLVPRDIADVPVALAAIRAKVDCLVSSDKDMTDPTNNEKLHSQLKVVLPGTFLREYMGWTGEALSKIRYR